MASTCPRARSPPLSPTRGHTVLTAGEPRLGHLNPARRAGTPAEQTGPGVSRDEPPRAPGRRWRRPRPRPLPGRAHHHHRHHADNTPRRRAHREDHPAPGAPTPTRTHQPAQTGPLQAPPVLTSNKYRSHDEQVPFSRRISTVLANRKAGGEGPARRPHRRRQYPGLTGGVGTWWPRPRSPCRRPLRPAGAPPPSAAAPRPRPRPRPCGRCPGRGPRWCGWRA